MLILGYRCKYSDLRVQRMVSDSWELKPQMVVSQLTHWSQEPSSQLLEDQYLLLTTDPFLQLLTSYIFRKEFPNVNPSGNNATYLLNLIFLFYPFRRSSTCSTIKVKMSFPRCGDDIRLLKIMENKLKPKIQFTMTMLSNIPRYLSLI